MPSESRHISVGIARPAGVVYDYIGDPTHLPEWAAGLSGSIEQVDGEWVAESPMGRVIVAFVPKNDYGVVDHAVTLPSGEVVINPMRVIRDGQDCEVVFTLRRAPGVSADDFGRDADAVAADLATLKALLETGSRPGGGEAGNPE